MMDSFQSTQIPIVLPYQRAQPNLSFPMTQDVGPAAIRQFLQSESSVAYNHALDEKGRSISMDSADWYFARERPSIVRGQS